MPLLKLGWLWWLVFWVGKAVQISTTTINATAMQPLLLVLQMLLGWWGTTRNARVLMNLLALLRVRHRWLLLLKLRRMDHLRRIKRTIEERHWLRSGSSISCRRTYMCRNWYWIWTVLQNCQVLGFIAWHIWVVEAHCCGTSNSCRGSTDRGRITGAWWSCATCDRRLYWPRTDRSSCCCLLLVQREDKGRPMLKFNKKEKQQL